VKKGKLHLTNSKGSPPMGGSGSDKTAVGLRTLCVFSPPHFAVAGLATQALISNRKTSVTWNVRRHKNQHFIRLILRCHPCSTVEILSEFFKFLTKYMDFLIDM